jgi:DNA-binding XRE family transcriptional regulator
MADIKTYMYLIGSHIKVVRNSRHVSQETLAHTVGISRAYMGFIEQGRNMPRVEVLINISEALNVTLSQLVDYNWTPAECDIEYQSDKVLYNER